jgi:murein DD-endopeptidase MepM/ murein hydrolase activator NlpD
MLTPTDVALANNFEGNKGKMYWPVTQGYISDHFGVHPSPLSKYVIVDNDGIDIRTSANAPVRAVFEGTVGSVFTVEGTKVVAIQHGNFFTVYNNLASTSVVKGQHVNTLQTIGVVAENEEGEPTIKFQIWKSNGHSSVKLNPELWIGKAR